MLRRGNPTRFSLNFLKRLEGALAVVGDGRWGIFLGGREGALAGGAAIEIVVHEAGGAVWLEEFAGVRDAETCGDFPGDKAEAAAEFIDEAKEAIAVLELGTGVEEAGGEGAFIAGFAENGVAVFDLEMLGDKAEAAIVAVGEDGLAVADHGDIVLIVEHPVVVVFFDTADIGVFDEIDFSSIG